MRYDDSIIDQILSAISIVEEFEALGIKTERRGRSGEYSAFCPFHNDHNNPNLFINEEKGVYNCFSCQAKGNVFTLLKEKKGLEFREAVKYMAEKSGVDVSGYDYSGANKEINKRLELINKLSQINQFALEYFQTVLNRTEKALNYLKGRALSPSTIGAFQLGFGGEGKAGLFEFLKAKGFNLDDLTTGGLVGHNNNGDVYDLFRDRVIFPIVDKRGRISGFSGRLLDDQKGRAKYMNTKETPLFKKDSLLYGYYENSHSIRDIKTAILVEGFMDVIGLWQSGVRFSVAAMGTAFSDKQAVLLQKSGAEQIFLMLDSDKAGEKAASSALISLSGKIKTMVVKLPEGKDPDEVALSGGMSAIEKLCCEAEEPIVFLSKDLNLSFEFIKKEPSEIQKEKLLSKLAGLIGVSVEAVKKDFYSKFNKGKVVIEEKDGEKFEGKAEWANWDGSIVVINKDWQMFQRIDREEEDKRTQEKVKKTDWAMIQSSHVIIPKYRVKQDDETFYTLECRRPNTKPFLITIPEERFGEATKLQNYFVKHGVAIQVGRMRQVLHAYCLSHSKEVKIANVGVNFTEGNSFLAGYDFIFKDGQYYSAKDNIVDTGEEIYFITGYNLKRVNESKLIDQYSKSKVCPEGKIQEFLQKSDRLFKTKEKSRITAAFLVTAMLREKLVKRFTEVPSLNFYGQTPSVGKTTFLDALSAITNIEKHRAKITEHQLYKLQENRINGLILIDDMRPIEDYVGFLKDAASNSYRPRRDLEGKLNNPQIRNSVFITTNHSISLESEQDSEALESRVINIHFVKEDQRYDYKVYRDFENFVKDNALDIYIDFYNKVSKIEMNQLEGRVEEIEEQIVKLDLKSTRIIKMWSILLACGESVGIKMKVKEYLEFIAKSESEKLNKVDFLASALMECAVTIEKEANPLIISQGETKRREIKEKHSIKDERNNLLFEPAVFSIRHYVKLSDASDFFRSSQMLKDYSQENVMKEIYSLPFVVKHTNISRTQWIKGEKKERNGTYIEINFGHEIFKKSIGVDVPYAYQLPPTNVDELDYSIPADMEKLADNPGF
jgi:DNA primase